MRKTVVINAVGLTPGLIGEHTPHIRAFAAQGITARIGDVLPAVTCSVQATYLTGVWPADHGIVGNGWYFRDECEIKFWRQSNKHVQRPKIWETATALDPAFTCANVCWWFNMYSSANFAVTPRPMYPADGRKLPDVWTHPASLRDDLQHDLGQFPLFKFWGPATTIESTQWIADAAIAIDKKHNPTLTLIYLPHLDYCMQRTGPSVAGIAKDLEELDGVVGQLIDHYDHRDASIILLSEYGIEPVSQPVHINRILREAGLITIREELGLELLDPGASAAFAVADHQIAHVYINDASRKEQIAELLRATPGIAEVLDDDAKRAAHLDHPRSGDLVAIASPHAWFTYYYWLDDDRAPDFARTVDIHRKPGYDPVELFLDPALASPKLKIAWTLLKRKLGFRALLDVIPLDATLVKGSHGRPAASAAEAPLLITREKSLVESSAIAPTAVHEMILGHLRR